jgi:hypothetical protein
VSVRLYFINFRIVPPIWTKYGIMVEDISGEVLDI